MLSLEKALFQHDPEHKWLRQRAASKLALAIFYNDPRYALMAENIAPGCTSDASIIEEARSKYQEILEYQAEAV